MHNMRRQQICTVLISAIFESHLQWVLPPHKHLSSHKRAHDLRQQQQQQQQLQQCCRCYCQHVAAVDVADDVANAIASTWAAAAASFVFFSARLNCQRRLKIHLHKLAKAFGGARAGKRWKLKSSSFFYSSTAPKGWSWRKEIKSNEMKCVEIKCGKRRSRNSRWRWRWRPRNGDPLSTLNYLSTIGYRIVILNIERPLADSNNNTSNNNGNNYNNDKSKTKVGGGTAAAVT